jgi:hypothetical protein
MLLDKLWVRIRGQLLSLKEDLLDQGELRQKAEDFLAKLEEKMESDVSGTEPRPAIPERLDAVLNKMEQAVADARRAAQDSSETKRFDRPTFEELEAAWEELLRLRKEKKSQPPAPEKEEASPKPPRTLG